MRAEVSQPVALAPGFALVTVSEVQPMDPATVEFSVESPPRGFLQDHLDTPWGTTHAWLRPAEAINGADGLELTLGPDRTWFMRPNVTYVLRLRDATQSAPLMLRIAWKGIRMPSQAPSKLPEVPQRIDDANAGAKPPEPPTEEIRSPELERQNTIQSPVEIAQSSGSTRILVVWAALALLLIGGVTAWFLMNTKPTPVAVVPSPTPPRQEAPSGPLGAASARAFLQTSPGSQETFGEAQRYLKDGSLDALQGALVLLGRAAEVGSGPAQTALGRMYDPDTYTPQTSAMKAPDPDKALLWYQRAAKSNDPEALYRLGRLLLSGRASGPGLGPEQGAADLQRAVDLGFKDAQAEIDKLRSKPN
jgi:hypothetical protein